MALLIFETETMESDIVQTFLPFLKESTLSHLCKTTLIKFSAEKRGWKLSSLGTEGTPWYKGANLGMSLQGWWKRSYVLTVWTELGPSELEKGRKLGRHKGLYSCVTCGLHRRFHTVPTVQMTVATCLSDIQNPEKCTELAAVKAPVSK